MRLGYNTNGLQNHRLDDALRLLADSGYEAVALTPDVGHLDPYRCTPSEVAAIAQLLQSLSLSCSIETGARYLLDPATKHEPTLMTRDRDGLARRLDYLERCARLGRDLGARVVSFWTGIDRRPGDDSYAWMRDAVRQACACVREVGLQPALEPEPGMAVSTFAQWRALSSGLGKEAPALTLDVGHLYAELEGDPVAVCRAAAPSCVQVHLEDMKRSVHEHLLPGDGDVDFRGVLGALRDGGYDGPVCFELSRHSHAAPHALQVCRRTWLSQR